MALDMFVHDFDRRPWNPYECIDCGADTAEFSGIDEYYMVNYYTWLEAFGLYPDDFLDTNEDYLDLEDCPNGMLCVGCLEARIGRTLEKDDFIDYPINTDLEYPKSDRLLNRLSNGESLWLVRERYEQQDKLIGEAWASSIQ